MKGIKGAIQRKVILSAVNRAFDKVESQAGNILPKGQSLKLDLFNSGIQIDIGRVLKNYLPGLIAAARVAAEKEIKKL